MLRLEWTTPAADQLEHAQDYYHALNPMAATLMAMRIVEATKALYAMHLARWLTQRVSAR